MEINQADGEDRELERQRNRDQVSDFSVCKITVVTLSIAVNTLIRK